MSGGSTTTTTNQVSATNPELNNLFTQLFGGSSGGASSAMSYLQGLMLGKGTPNVSSIDSGFGQVNTAALQNANTAAAQQNIQSGATGVREAFGASGLAYSSDVAKSLGSYYNQAYSNLQQQNAQIGLQGSEFNAQTGLQLQEFNRQQQLAEQEFGTQAGMQSANAILNLFGQASNQYYTSKSKQQTSTPWYNNVMSAVGGAVGIASGLGDISAAGGITGSLAGLWS